jgi:hypothetical protein
MINSNSIKAIYLKKLESRVEDALNVTGEQTVSWAVDLCPFKTGNLSHSLNCATSKKQGVLGGKTDGTLLEKATEKMTVKIGTNVKYAARIEFGFSGKDSLGRSINQGGTPFLRGALLSHKKDIVEIFARAFKNTSAGVE